MKPAKKSKRPTQTFIVAGDVAIHVGKKTASRDSLIEAGFEPDPNDLSVYRKANPPRPSRRSNPETGWIPLVVPARDGTPKPKKHQRWNWNPLLRSVTWQKNGTYAIKHKDRIPGTKSVLYVGESHSNRLWKTLIRHFQGQDSFEPLGEWTSDRPEDLRVKVRTTRTPQAAVKTEKDWIRDMKPLNESYMHGRAVSWQEEIPF